jgi:hypothetical protein
MELMELNRDRKIKAIETLHPMILWNTYRTSKIYCIVDLRFLRPSRRLRRTFESAELVRNSPTLPSPIYWPLGVDRRQGKNNAAPFPLIRSQKIPAIVAKFERIPEP